MSIRASVIVCTRNRPDLAEKAIANVGAEMPEWCELIVVDQSDDDRTLQAVERVAGRARVRYVRAEPRGLSAARNVGARVAAGDLLLYTDDDCLIDPGWVELWDAEFAADPGAGLGFGRVDCPPEEARRGYTPDFLAQDGDYGLDLFLRGHGSIGMGANMVVRRRVLEELSGFDERLAWEMCHA